MKNLIASTVLVSISLGLAASAAADSAFYNASIRKLVANAETGLCAAWVIPGPADEGLALCNNRWVSFDCSGDFGSKSSGNTAFNMAQLAFVTRRSISISVTDASRLDVGSTQYCFANQVQITQ